MMGNPIITVEGLWKKYRLGDTNAASLKEEVHEFWKKHLSGNSASAAGDPVTDNHLTSDENRGFFWALKDINFTVSPGEVLGVIGKNGAGKSTLLKLLSRISRPTRGRIRGYGKVASMLEVGTGFHEELTGRENVFLNGNIMGMSNAEIKRKLDQIIDFAGISRFMDTPVKRYSSGMYVRLAFAVAAHLDPDILILDEVLSVGDTEFQEKSLRKMQDIATNTGCTIIYVTHNIPSVLQLCQRAILLREGQIQREGPPREIVNLYYELMGKRHFHQQWPSLAVAPGNEIIRMRQVSLAPELPDPQAEIDVRTPLHIHFEFLNRTPGINLSIGIHLFTAMDACIFDISSLSGVIPEGEFEGSCTIPGDFLNDGSYYVSIIFVRDTLEQVFYLEKCLTFDVADYRGDIQWQGKWMGAVRPHFPVTFRPKIPRKPYIS
jgi:lipopolysaccharide transport system ATP-binding protein